VLDAVDDVAEVIADVAEGFNGHGHNCGALTARRKRDHGPLSGT
jgi:hypothetical protein